MAKLEDLIAQRAALDSQIEEIRKEETSNAVVSVREIIEKFGLSASDIFPSKSKKATGGKVAPKYRDPQSGNTWTGRGKAPKWIDGKARETYLIV
jgi:DNA-binding protein H-NS